MEESILSAKIQAEGANRAKSIFLTTMSHEIRTPLNAVLGFSDLLYKQITNPTQKNYLESIRSSGSTLLKIINDILDLSKIESGKMDLQVQPADLFFIITDLSKIFDLIIKEKNLSIKVEYSSEIPQYLYLDELRIRQILYNLINNAIKFTEKGYVKIEVICTRKTKTYVDLQLNVIDTGIGIKPESQIKIFEAFQQQDEQDARKYGGTGLGLAITRRLAEIMNGTIHLKSEEKKGSCFMIVIKKIKIAKSDTVSSKQITELEPIIFDKAIILLVDDIKSNRDVVKGYLKDFDFKIIEAKNGIEAIDSALKNKPNLIFMDLKMPEMDGIEATKILRNKSLTKNIPIIALTASAYNVIKEESQKHGFSSYLSKPVKENELILELTKYLKYKKIQIKTSDKNFKYVKDLSIDTIEKLPEIIEELEGEIYGLWLSLQKRQPVKEVKHFLEIILKLGQKHNLQILIDYSNKLKLALDSFDIEKMRNQLSRYNELIEQLKINIKI
jgi:two-component system sensor histidine kinase EvgS